MMNNLVYFLEQKPLYYKEIDYTRMPKAWESIKDKFQLPKIIHIVGTNGKGSTGRFLAWHLHKQGFKVGHYSSPHILKFNERIWIDGLDVSDDMLDNAHKYLQDILDPKVSDLLSYFEYTTLLAMVIFKECKYIVLEAGLGGEYDATSVFKNILTLATTIDLDHESFLGENIKDIATTKLKATKEFLILGHQNHKEVFDVADDLRLEYKSYKVYFDKNELLDIQKSIKNLNLSKVFSYNLALALSAIKYLGFSYDLKYIKDIKLFGRVQKIAPNITIDVGHNALAALSLVEHFKDKKINLIFNTFADKDYKKSLMILKPIIKKVFIIDIENQRVEEQQKLRDVLSELMIDFDSFSKLDDCQEYLVFGSFSVVESFLKRYTQF